MSAVVEHREALPIVQEQATSILQIIDRAARDPNVDIDKMERLMQMHERILEREAEAAFNEALNLAQSEIGRIKADAENKQTRSWYATYAQMDRVVRPIYTKHGFSLSFDEADSPKQDHIRVLCYVARGRYKRTYHTDMPADGKGAKGGDVMTKTHAAGSAKQYGRRYLLKDIFNIAIGDEDDDGNGAGGDYITEEQVADLMALADEVRANRQKFLAFMKVEKLSDIKAKDYQKAVAALEAKRR